MALTSLSEKLSEYEQKVRESGDETITTNVFAGIRAVRTKVNEVAQEVADKTPDFTATTFACDALVSQAESMLAMLDSLLSAPQAILGALNGFVDTLTDKITGMLPSLVFNELRHVAEAFSEALAFVDQVNAVVDGLQAAIATGFATADELVAAVNGALGNITGILGSCSCLASGALAPLSGITSALNDAEASLNDKVDAVSAALGPLRDAAKLGVLSQLDTMFASTIAGKLDGLTSQIGSMLDLSSVMSPIGAAFGKLDCAATCLASVCGGSAAALAKAQKVIDRLDSVGGMSAAASAKIGGVMSQINNSQEMQAIRDAEALLMQGF